MATVSVTTWAEFLTAIAVSGDTVELPENAVWDLNEIEPLGHLEDILVACRYIIGNGTRIRNLHLFGCINFTGLCDISNLFLSDFIGSGSPTYKGFFRGNVFFHDCGISGLLGNGYDYLLHYTQNYAEYAFERCSINVEASSQSFTVVFGGSYGFIYCRLEVHAANSANQPSHPPCRTCECIFYMPNCSSITTTYFLGCTVRGDLQNAQEAAPSWSEWSGDNTVYVSNSFPQNFSPVKPANFIAVTEEQMKTPAYLRNLGFPIVVDGGDDS